MGRAVRISAALTSAACVGVILLAPVLLRLAYGGKFVGASNVLRILAAEALVAGATWVLAQAFLALGKPAVVTGLQACGLLLTIPLMILLIPRLGLVGAGLSLLISTTARFLFIVCSYPLLLHSRPPQLLLQASDIAFVRSRLLDRTNVAPAPITDS